MALDGITVAHIAHELQTTLKDGRIHKIAQPEADELLLTFKLPRGQRRLSISASASLPLIYLTEVNKPSPMTAPNFCMLLRKHLNNGRIVEIRQPQLERILEFHIEHMDELGDLGKKILIVELMGRHSNIIFCNNDYVIIDSIKRISGQVSSVREVLPGRTYFVPDTMQKLDPLNVSHDAFKLAISNSTLPVPKALNTSFTGISYGVAHEICHLIGLDADCTADSLTGTQVDDLYTAFIEYFNKVKTHDFSAHIYLKDGEPKEYASLPLSHLSDCDVADYQEVSQVLHSYYESKNIITRIRQKSADLRHIVQTALDRSKKKLHLQEKQLDDTNNRDKYKVYGELLHTYGYGVSAGDSSLVALNYYTNEDVTIPLDPTLSAMENAQKYFNRYNKQKRTFEALTELILETSADVDYLESVANSLEMARSEDDLMGIKDELIEAGYVKRRHVKKKVKYNNKPLHYISTDGYHIYVGKNNLQNEEITFNIAEGNDWWFHAKDAAGSHVLVKYQGVEMPDRVFEEAGKLAAYYSKLRGGSKVEIDYIEKKHVKKPKGGKPGLVIYHTNYSLVIDSDISMLEEFR